MNFQFMCPICSQPLFEDNRAMKCSNNHSFDIARQGYVNLLLSQKSSKKRHGDDALMVNSRRDFLDKGYYDCLCDKIIESIGQLRKSEMNIADLGCGECYYTHRIAENFPNSNICGIDISKSALIAGARRDASISLAVASTAQLPIPSNSCDVVVTVFAPHSTGEIYRILKNNGVWIKAFPSEKHLFGLKKVIYDEPYLNEVDDEVPNGFELLNHSAVEGSLYLTENSDIMNLFRMTPYYYKTSSSDQHKVETLNELDTEIMFIVDVFGAKKCVI